MLSLKKLNGKYHHDIVNPFNVTVPRLMSDVFATAKS